ncbi:MAG: hypothetical protein BVN33_04100 [Proteobacteria bacterium ST_bin13]|nr:MAG: hypothetical protein BVN33_04100 [Proteobacteria bacterium ST_bin13]
MRKLLMVVISLLMVAAPSAVAAFPLGESSANASDAASNTADPPTIPPETPITPNAGAADPSSDVKLDETLPDSVAILIRLFVLAVVLESALATVFRWRPYVANIETRTVNPLLAFLFALIMVRLFQLDQVGVLVASYSNAPNGTVSADNAWASSITTALVIAGGSAGVNRMLRTLGFRAIETEAPAQKPAPTEAWIAIIDTSGKAGARTIFLDQGSGWEQIGVLRQAPKWGIFQWLRRDTGRFPSSGGRAVPIGVDLQIAVGDSNTALPSAAIWGPRKLAGGAIVDIVVS